MDQFRWNNGAANALPICGTIIWPDSGTPAHSCPTARPERDENEKNEPN